MANACNIYSQNVLSDVKCLQGCIKNHVEMLHFILVKLGLKVTTQIISDGIIGMIMKILIWVIPIILYLKAWGLILLSLTDITVWIRNYNHSFMWNVVTQPFLISVPVQLNSLRPCDTIWRHISGSTLAQVMACCLTAPSHYPNQCWLITSKV